MLAENKNLWELILSNYFYTLILNDLWCNIKYWYIKNSYDASVKLFFAELFISCHVSFGYMCNKLYRPREATSYCSKHLCFMSSCKSLHYDSYIWTSHLFRHLYAQCSCPRVNPYGILIPDDIIISRYADAFNNPFTMELCFYFPRHMTRH